MIQCKSVTPQKQVFSSGDFWKGFSVELHEFPAVESAVLSSDKHCMLFNWADPIGIEILVDGKWKDSICDKGALVCLSSAGNPPTFRWNQSFHALVISITPELANSVLELKEFTFVDQFNTADPFLLDIATKLAQICAEQSFAEEVYAESLVVAGIVHLAKMHRGAKDGYFPKGRLNPYQLKQVVDFAYSYMQFNIGLHEMAGLVHLSPYHFGRLFKQTVGRSPYQFILQLKIECAKKLIKQHNGPISEIAYQLNFSDQSHFSNAFRKATGISPRQYMYS